MTKIPDFQDEVKHKERDASGTVIAIYTIDNVTYLDVRLDDLLIYYGTPASNWETVIPADE